LFRGAPGGYHPGATAFDADVVAAVADRQTDRLDELAGQDAGAGESALAPLTVLMSATPRHLTTSVLSYELPFGCGYLVAALVPG
jgi:hypothetical protein